MEDTKSRLSRLLSKERAMRKEETYIKDETVVVQSVSNNIYNGIDTSPVTSPENMLTARRRLSRLFERRTYNYSKQEPSEILSNRLFHESKRAFNPKPNLNTELDHKNIISSPIRVRKRVTIQSNERPLPSEVQHSPRITTHHRGQSRSLSPISKRNNHLPPSPYRMPPLVTDMNIADDDSSILTDLNAFEDMDYKLVSKINAIQHAKDIRSVSSEISTSVTFLSRAGMKYMQLWVLNPSLGVLVNETSYNGGRATRLNANQTELLLNFTKDSSHTFSDAHSSILFNSSNVNTWLPEHFIYQDIADIVKLGMNDLDGLSRNNMSGDFFQDHKDDHPKEKSKQSRVIFHALKILKSSVNVENMSQETTIGVILVTEIAPPALPFSSFFGVKENNMLKLRRFLLLQLLQKICYAVENRFLSLQIIEEKKTNFLIREETDCLLAEKEDVLSIKENVMKSTHNHLIFKEKFQESLLACASLLLENTSLQSLDTRQHSAFVATVIARSGCLQDLNDKIVTNCWLIVKNIPNYSDHFDNIEYKHVPDSPTVGVVTGNLNEGGSPIYLQDNNKLISKLIHDSEVTIHQSDNRKQHMNTISVTRQEIVDAGLHTSHHISQTNLTLMYIAIELTIPDRIIKDGPGYGFVKMTLVMSVASEESYELGKDHIISLAQLAKQGFDGIFSQDSMFRKQQWNEIPAILFESLSSVKDNNSEIVRINSNRIVPSFEISLQSLLDLSGSYEVATRFNVRKSVLILSDILVFNFNLIKEPNDLKKLSFFQSNGNAIQPILCPAIDISMSSWIQDLLNGKIVYYDINEANSTITSIDFAAVALPGNISRSNPIRAFSNKAYASSRLLLKGLIQAVDPNANYCMMIPIQSTAGLSILILIDPISYSVKSKSNSSRGEILPFSNDLKEFIQVSGSIPKVIVHNIEVLYQQSLSYWFERNTSDDKHNINQREEKLCILISSMRTKSILLSAYLKWKLSARDLIHKSSLDRISKLQSCIMELVTHRIRSEPMVDCKKSFLHVFESQLTSLFPIDSINIASDDTATGFSFEENEENSVQYEDNGARIHLHRSIVCYNEIINQNYEQPTWQHSNNFNNSFNKSTDKQHSLQKKLSKVIATVRISRPSQLNKPFTANEINDFDKFCDIASDIYTSLSRGHYTEFVSGDVRSLAIPLLNQLVPALLASPNVLESGSMKPILPLLILWLKRACGADMVLLRLSPSFASASSKDPMNHNNAGIIGEILLSSEEIDEKLVQELIKKSANSWSHLYELSQLQAVSNSNKSLEATFEQNDSDMIVLRLNDLSSSNPVQLGEVKLFNSNKKQFTNEQRSLAHIVSYLLTHSICNTSKSLDVKSKELQMQSENMQLQQNINNLQHNLMNEKQNTEGFKLRLGNVLSSLVFTEKLCSTSTLQMLCSMICDGFPQLLGMSSAVLILHPSQIEEGVEYDVNKIDSFRVILPKSNRPSDILESSAYASLSNSSMSMQQLLQIPILFENPKSSQSKIELLSPNDGNLYGAIILFRSNSMISADLESDYPVEVNTSYKLWQGFEDILQSSISAVVYQSLFRFRYHHELLYVKTSLNNALVTLKEQEHFDPDFKNLMNVKISLETQRDSLSVEVNTLKKTIDDILLEKQNKLKFLEDEVATIKKNADENSLQLNEKISELCTELENEQSNLQELLLQKQQLLDLVSSFSFDHRCHKEKVVSWLRDVAESVDTNLIVIKQSDGGVLHGAEHIRGIIATVSEAIRTGQTMEFTTALLSNNSLTSTSTTTQLRNINLSTNNKRNEIEYNHNDKDQLQVLCIPNRCIAGNNIDTDYACFIFIKKLGADEVNYSIKIKDLLNCAANLSSRTLVQANARFGEKEFKRLDMELDATKSNEARLKQALNLGNLLRDREYQSKLEISKALDVGISQILSRGPEDPCIVESILWLPPWNTSINNMVSNSRMKPISIKPSYTNAEESDLDALNRVLNNGKTIRHGGICWIPLIDFKKQIIAILKVERKFADHFDMLLQDLPSRVGGSNSPTESFNENKSDVIVPTMMHLIINEVDVDMLSFYAAFAIPLLERMDFISDAYSGVKQAGQAIVMLQESKVLIEDKYAMEVAHRLELEESLKTGAEMLGLTCSTRISTGQLLDSTRKNILSITSSIECFIIMPSNNASNDISSNKDNDTEETEEQKSIGITAHNNAAYCTLVSDLPREVEVRFEPGDLEAAAMQSLRSVSAPNMEAVTVGEHVLQNRNKSWQSWAVRRVQGRLAFGQEINDSSKEDNNFYVLAVPFALRTGVAAVITVVRRIAPYSCMDRECILWVSKVLAYCLEMKGGEETLVQTIQQIKTLKEELSSLHEIDNRLEELEEDNNLLEIDLSNFLVKSNHKILTQPDISIPFHSSTIENYSSSLTDKCDSDSKDLILTPELIDREGYEILMSVAKIVFGDSSIVESWSAAEAVKRFGIILPLESLMSSTTKQTTYNNQLSHLSIGKNKVPMKDTIVINKGQLTYWVDSEGKSYEGLDFFKLLDQQSTAVSISSANHNIYVSVPQSISGVVLYIIIQLQGYPITWLKIQTISEIKVINNLKLRLKIMLQILTTQEQWRTKAITIHNDFIKNKLKTSQEKNDFIIELEKRCDEIEELKSKFTNHLDQTKNKYKFIINEKSINYKQAENIFTETLVYTRYLHSTIINSIPMKNEELFQIIQKYILRYSESLQIVSNMSISIGQCGIIGFQEILSMEEEKDNLLVNEVNNVINNQDMINKMKIKSYTSHKVPTLNWLTDEPAIAWNNPNHTISNNNNKSKNNKQSNSLQVELFDSISQTNPLHIAISTGKIVIMLEDGKDRNDLKHMNDMLSLKETLQALYQKICLLTNEKATNNIDLNTSNAIELNIIFMNPTNKYPAYTIIVPIKISLLKTTMVAFIRPNVKEEKENIIVPNQISKYAFCSMLAGWLYLKQSISDLIQFQIKEKQFQVSSIEKQKKAALSNFKHLFNSMDAQLVSKALTKALVIERMKNKRWESKWNIAASLQPQLQTTKAQLSVLEQLSADWTELVKGVNGAAGGISNGIPGLWAQASRTLMNMLSSHLTLKSCGLLVPKLSKNNDIVDILEYAVRELSTPLSNNQLRQQLRNQQTIASESDIADYSRATLESRSASELGANVFNLVQDILDGRTGNQRIFKLSRPQSSKFSNGEESLWLVPIKTARSILAVLRVSVELPRLGRLETSNEMPEYQSPLKQTLRTLAASMTELQDKEKHNQHIDQIANRNIKIEELLRQETDLLEAAQSNMINFAEVLAPLCVAAQLIEQTKEKNDLLGASVDQSTSQLRLMTQELNTSTRKSSLLSTVVSAIGTLSFTDLPTTNNNTPEEMLRMYCNRLALVLSEQLSGRVIIHIHKDIITISESDDKILYDDLDISRTTNMNKSMINNSISNPPTISEIGNYSELLKDHEGISFGKIMYSTSKASSSIGGGENETDHHSVATTPAKKLTFASNSINTVVLYALKPIAVLISGLLLQVAKEIRISKKNTLIATSLQVKEESLQFEKQQVIRCNEKYDEQVLANKFYQDLTDIVNQCLLYVSSAASSNSQQEEKIKRAAYGDDYKLSMNVGLLDMLSSLCHKLPSLVGQCCSFSFAILDLSNVNIFTPDNSRDEEQQKTFNEMMEKSVLWVHGNNEGSINTSSNSNIDWHIVNQKARDILLNLANSCIAKKLKTVFDIGLNVDYKFDSYTDKIDSFSNIRVLTYPLLDSKNNDCHGVIQCMLDPYTLSTNNNQHIHVENICEDISNTIACVLSVEAQQQKLYVKMLHQKLNLLTTEENYIATQEIKNEWQERCIIWQRLEIIATNIIKTSITSNTIIEVLQSNSIVSLLSELGIQILIKSDANIESKHLKTILPLDELTNDYVEISSDTNEINLTKTDFIDHFIEIIQNVINIFKIKRNINQESQNLNNQALSKIEKLKTEVRIKNEELMNSINKHDKLNKDIIDLKKDFNKSLEKYKKFNHSLSTSFSRLYLPAVSDITTMLQNCFLELIHDQSIKSQSIHELNSWIFENINKSIDRVVSRFTEVNCFHHCSILVRTSASALSDILQVQIYDGVKSNADLIHTITTSNNEHNILSSYLNKQNIEQRNNKVKNSNKDSMVEQCLRYGGIHEATEELIVASDLIGINHSTLKSLFDSNKSINNCSCSMLCLPLLDSNENILAVIRIIHHTSTVPDNQINDFSSKGVQQFNSKLLRPIMEMISNLGTTFIQVVSKYTHSIATVDNAKVVVDEGKVQIELSQQQLSRSRKLYRVVCREVSTLLDPPIIGSSIGTMYSITNSNSAEGLRVVHPAALTPLAASQDICLKLLNIIRTLLRTEGQAIILRDLGTDPISYQVIYTGDSLIWTGIESSTFGVISPQTNGNRQGGGGSLVESTIHSRKSFHTANAPSDPKYNAYIDGICDLGTPVLMVPMRGRGGTVVGTLIAAKGKNGSIFTSEDMIAAEICSSFGALSLYWCQGMGTLHQQLLRSTHKMDKLEKMVKKLSESNK